MTSTPGSRGDGAAFGEPPLIVIDGPVEAFHAAVADVRRGGWRVVPGFGGSVGGQREVRAGAIGSVEDAAAVMLVVLAGAGAVIHGAAGLDTLDRLLDDLRHVRRVDVRRGSQQAVPSIDPDARAILVILAEGRTLGDAAAELGLSRRTADRRLAEARTALGVERTIEAVALARRLGWLG